MKADGSAIDENGEESDAGGDRRTARRGMGARQHEIAGDHDEARGGRHFLAGNAQGQPGPRRNGETKEKERRPADRGRVQAGDG